MATASQTIAIYNAVLQRDPTDAELATFVSNSQTDAGEDTQIDLLVNSSEANSFVAPIVRLYQATFGRVPDAAGLDFWSDFLRAQVEDGATTFDVLTTINAGFAASTEFEARFPEAASDGIVDETFLTALYQQTFGRVPTDDDKEFYVGTQISATLSAFAQSSETIDMFDDYVDLFLTKSANGNQDFEGSLLDADDDGDVDADDAAAVDPNQPVEGVERVFTAAVGEILEGTSDDDEFRGVVDNNAGDFSGGTVNIGDSADGMGGTDTLNLTIASGAAAAATVFLPAGSSFANIEIVNLLQAADTLADTADGLDASLFSGATQLWQVDGAVGVNNLAAETTAGFRDVDASVTVEADTDAASVSVALDNVDDASALAISEETPGDVETVTVSGSVDGDFDLDVATGTTAVETLNLSISSDSEITTLAVDNAVLTTLNASGSTGDLTVDISGITALESATFGSGSDTVEAALDDTAATTFDFGAGNDIVTFDGTGGTDNVVETLTLGAGSDSLTISALSNLADASESAFADGLVIVTDFNASTDVLDASRLGDQTVQNTVNGAVDGATSLFDALDAAASVTATGDYALFDYDGNAYLYVNDGDAGLDEGDGLLQLTGISVSDLDASNFVAA